MGMSNSAHAEASELVALLKKDITEPFHCRIIFVLSHGVISLSQGLEMGSDVFKLRAI